MTGRAKTTSLACLLSLMAATAHSAEKGAPVPAEPVATDVFQDARLLSKPDDWYTYPSSERARGREGWVMLNMMISSTGKPYEATVLDSSGIAALNAAAVKALDKMSFQAARIGQTPVDSSFTLTIKFSIFGTVSIPSHGFRSAYDKLTKAIEAHDKAVADAELGKLQPETLNEDSGYGLRPVSLRSSMGD